jgi:hypothetical protein
MWGVGGASLITGAVFGGLALSAKSDFDKTPTYTDADTVHERSVVADVTLGLGVILVATATIFYFVDGQPPPATTAKQPSNPLVSRLSVSPTVGAHSKGAALSLVF